MPARMKVSIRTTLSVIIGTMGLFLSIFCIGTFFFAFQNASTAWKVGRQAEADGYVFQAYQMFRIERGDVLNALEADGAAPEDVAKKIADTRSHLESAFHSAIAAIERLDGKAFTDLRDRLVADHAAVDTLRPTAEAAVRQPKEKRTDGLANAWNSTGTKLIASLAAASDALETAMSGNGEDIDLAIDIKQSATLARSTAGVEILQIGRILTAGRGMSAEQQVELAELRGQTAAAWEVVRRAARASAFPASLKATVDKAESDYFGSAAEARAKTIKALASGNDPGIGSAEWLERGTRQLIALGASSNEAMRLSQIAADELESKALSVLIGSGVVLVLVQALVGIGLLVVDRRVASPLRRLTGVMKELAQGRYETTVTDQDHANEVGEMARSVQVFKNNGLAMEDMRREQEAAKVQAAEERRAAMLVLATRFETQLKGVIDVIGDDAEKLQTTAAALAAGARDAGERCTTVAAAAEYASSSVQTVASAAAELAASINEIGRQVGQTSTMSRQTMEEAKRTNEIMIGLSGAAQRIGEVVNLITTIASQTNLLALNATIEAARAGEAGKGFAVVAGEVKNLANQTAKATDEISQQIAGIQDATHNAVAAIEEITTAITGINDVAAAVAAAVEEQGAATKEIARNVQEVATNSRNVSSNIETIQRGTEESAATSLDVLEIARQLAAQSATLGTEADRFLGNVRNG